MKKIIMLAIVLIAGFSLNAQSQIEGKVLELSKEGSIIPIFGANVYWEGTNVGTVTDIKKLSGSGVGECKPIVELTKS